MIDRNEHPFTRISKLPFTATDDALKPELRALVAPDARLRLSGREVDLDGFLAHLRELRASMTGGTVTVVETLLDPAAEPTRAAAHTVVRMQMRDGSTLTGEAHLIGHVSGDGMITSMIEIGRVVTPEDDDPLPST